MQNQVWSFAMFIINGLIIGLLFDIFRIFRKSFKTPDFITYAEDIFFWIISGLILLYSIFTFNNGELRLFVFIGIALGISLYILIFSKIFINMSVYIINIIKKGFNILIIIPIKFIIKIIRIVLFKPSIFLYNKTTKIFKKIMSFIKKIFKKMTTKNRIYKNKKDFA